MKQRPSLDEDNELEVGRGKKGIGAGQMPPGEGRGKKAPIIKLVNLILGRIPSSVGASDIPTSAPYDARKNAREVPAIRQLARW